ncbi:MAG: hypothetical protein NT007_15595 [Candidatus Kapabacteria bacterium]|nr:hypothetical protein [Candidatus Kapabacteria bacterium]
MQDAGSTSNALLAQKTDKLMREIISLAQVLPKDSFFQFDRNLSYYVESIPEYINVHEHLLRKIDKARNMIQLNLVMKECIEKLVLIGILGIGNTRDIVKDANEVYNLIEEDYHISKYISMAS